jgi:hypothetical protein
MRAEYLLVYCCFILQLDEVEICFSDGHIRVFVEKQKKEKYTFLCSKNERLSPPPQPCDGPPNRHFSCKRIAAEKWVGEPRLG